MINAINVSQDKPNVVEILCSVILLSMVMPNKVFIEADDPPS